MTMLFFHFDGTSNGPDDLFTPPNSLCTITNVLKSHLLLGGRIPNCKIKLPQQADLKTFYYQGIGTYGNWAEQTFNAAFAIEAGHISQILNQALKDFHTHYTGQIQHIVLIGFSRGAALARRFASLITPLLGKPIIIEAIMDTVASIGIPSLDKQQRPNAEVVFEHGHTLPEAVYKALHLVALDEQRIAFRPTLINQDPRALELWLPGVHSDIGGGYRKDGLGDLALHILTQWIQSHTQQHCYDHSKQNQSTVAPHWQPLLTLEPKPLGNIHYQTRHFNPWRELTLAPRHCCVIDQGQPSKTHPPLWHQSVKQRIQSQLNYIPIAHSHLPPKIHP